MDLDFLIVQDISTTETRAVTSGAMLLDHPVAVLRCSLDALNSPELVTKLSSGAALPVGSVEFVREAMLLCGIDEPANMSYPTVLNDLLCREIHQVPAGHVLGDWFVKPVRTKAFTGFVFNTLGDPDLLDEHDQIQYAAFMALAADEPVWISEPTSFLCEWRYYVMDSKIIGRARYDTDGSDEAPEPDLAVVESAIEAMGTNPGTYVLDFGVIAGGETALVEANDAWAIGLYDHALSSREYLQFLGTRWDELRKTKLDSKIESTESKTRSFRKRAP